MKKPDTTSALIILLTAVMLNGCANTKYYRSSSPTNLTVTTHVESVKATLDIFTLEKECNTTHLGVIELTEGETSVSLPTEQPLYLVVGFASSSFLRSATGFTSSDLVIDVKAGYQYEMNVRYRDAIYSVEIYEISPGGGKRHELETGNSPSCRGQ